MSEKKLLTVIESAERARCSKDFIYSLVRDGELAAYRVGKRLLVPEPSLEDYIASRAARRPEHR